MPKWKLKPFFVLCLLALSLSLSCNQLLPKKRLKITGGSPTLRVLYPKDFFGAESILINVKSGVTTVLMEEIFPPKGASSDQKASSLFTVKSGTYTLEYTLKFKENVGTCKNDRTISIGDVLSLDVELTECKPIKPMKPVVEGDDPKPEGNGGERTDNPPNGPGTNDARVVIIPEVVN